MREKEKEEKRGIARKHTKACQSASSSNLHQANDNSLVNSSLDAVNTGSTLLDSFVNYAAKKKVSSDTNVDPSCVF